MKPILNLVVPGTEEYDGAYLGVATLGTYVKDLTEETILSNEPLGYADIIGISCTLMEKVDLYRETVEKALKLADNVLVGGFVPTKVPQVFKDFPDVILVKGYGEECLANFITSKKITGTSPSSVQPVDRTLLARFYEQPIPEYGEKVGSIITTRGCPHKCPYCSKMDNDNRVIFMPAKDIVEDLKTLSDVYDVHHIMLYDDNFMLSKRRLDLLIEYEEECNVHPRLDIQTRLDYITEDGIKRLKKLNVPTVIAGAESVNDKALSYLKPGITRKKIEKALSLCIENDINIGISFMYGTPVDTELALIELYDFIGEYCQDPHIMVWVFNAIPYPGTDFESKERELGYDPSLCWSERRWTYPNSIQMHNDVPVRFYRDFIPNLKELVERTNENCTWHV